MQHDHILRMENLYLKYLLLYEKYEDQNGPLFRTFIDNWYGFHEGGEMLSKGGRPKWFNNPDTHKIGPVLSSMHFVSQKARSVLSGQSNSRLVKDHAIPVVILRQMISSHDPKSIELVREFLLRNYRLGVITKEEDNDLNSKGLKSTMPTDWNGTNWKARYEFAGISGD